MSRVEQFEDKLRQLHAIADERELTADEEWSLVYTQERLSVQLEANERRSVQREAVAQRQNVSQRKAVWYHVRLSVTAPYTLETFKEMMLKMHKRCFVHDHRLVYVLEQSGAERDTRGKNPHAHIRFKSSYTAGRLLKEIKRATKLDGPAIKLHEHDNVNALRQYMLGNKGDPDKATSDEQREERLQKRLKCEQDKCWRIEQGLKIEYSYT